MTLKNDSLSVTKKLGKKSTIVYDVALNNLTFVLKTTHIFEFLFSDKFCFLSMTANPKPLSIVAKCALCSTKTELFVCPHCDEVICQICVNKHRSELNETLKEHWLKCKTKFQNLCQLSSIKIFI